MDKQKAKTQSGMTMREADFDAAMRAVFQGPAVAGIKSKKKRKKAKKR